MRTTPPSGTEPPGRRRVRLVAFAALVVAAYYFVPVSEPARETTTWLRASATAALLAGPGRLP